MTDGYSSQPCQSELKPDGHSIEVNRGHGKMWSPTGRTGGHSPRACSRISGILEVARPHQARPQGSPDSALDLERKSGSFWTDCLLSAKAKSVTLAAPSCWSLPIASHQSSGSTTRSYSGSLGIAGGTGPSSGSTGGEPGSSSSGSCTGIPCGLCGVCWFKLTSCEEPIVCQATAKVSQNNSHTFVSEGPALSRNPTVRSSWHFLPILPQGWFGATSGYRKHGR